MRVLLVQPRPKGGLVFKKLVMVEPLGLEIVGASLTGHDVRLVDMLDGINLDVAVQDFRPHAVGINCSFTVDVYQTLMIAEMVKSFNKNIFVFIGGHHASLSPTDFYHPAVDAIVMGEGETTAPELIAALEENADLSKVSGLVLNNEEGQFYTGDRPLLKALDEAPFPDRSLTQSYRRRYYLGMRRPVDIIETSRGCPKRCNFCSVWRFYRGQVRFMSPERVVEEIERLPAGDVLFTDDNFLANVSRAEKIANLLRAKGKRKKKYIFQARSDTIVRYPEVIRLWKEAGLEQVFIGFEKIDQEGMDRINKQNKVENNEKALKILRSNNIGVYASFIVDPEFTKVDFRRLLDYIKNLKIAQPYFSVLTPLPGTELFKQLKEHLTINNYEFFDLVHAVLPTRLPIKEFYREFAALYQKAYFRPTHVLPTLFWFFQTLLKGQLSFEHLRRLISGIRITANFRAYLSPVYRQ